MIHFLNQLNVRAVVRMYQGRKAMVFRSISTGNTSADAQGHQRPETTKTSEKQATTSNDPDNNNNPQNQQPVTSSLLEDIARIQRRPSMLFPKTPPITTAGKNIDETSTSFFGSSQAETQKQQQQESKSDTVEGSSRYNTESITKLLIQSTSVNSNQRRTSALPVPSNIPLLSESSIFDVFQVPEAPQIQISQDVKRSPNAYPLEAVKQYYEILEPIVTSKRFIRKNPEKEVHSIVEWLKADEPVLLHDLPTFQAALKGELDLPKEKIRTRSNIQMELSDQRTRFCKHYNLPDNKSTAVAQNGLNITTSMCARYGKGLPVEIIWEKMKESGIFPKDLLQNLMYVAATFTTGSARSRRKRRSKYGHLAGIASILDVLAADEFTNTDDNNNGEDETDLVDISDEIAILHDLLYEPSEQSINIRVKLLVAQGKAKEAERLLNDHASGTAELRLRAYTPVLRLFIELDDLSSALRLFRKMKDITTVHLDADAYMHLVAGIAEKGFFRLGAEPIESAKELGYYNMSGPGLFDELIAEMAQALFEIPAASAKRLYNALASGFPGSGLTETAVHSLKVNSTRAYSHDLLASRVYVDPIYGICPRSGVKLRLIHLNDDDKREMVDKVINRARTLQHRVPSKTGISPQKGENHLMKFNSWLDHREGRPFTVLIDGANVGYYHQNVEDGRFNFHQIKFMVDFLEERGENPLVIMPNKYGYDNFNISVGAPGYFPGSKQFFTQEEMYIRETLGRFGKLFYVPGGLLGESNVEILFCTMIMFLLNHPTFNLFRRLLLDHIGSVVAKSITAR